MLRVPEEYLIRHAAHEVGRYFSDLVAKNRSSGKVAVLIEESVSSLYFMPCNERGYPRYGEFKALEFEKPFIAALAEEAIPLDISTTITEITVRIETVPIGQQVEWDGPPHVFLWSGRKLGTERIPLEKLDVLELQRVAQVAIRNREGLIIDQALKNKLYK